MKTKPAIALLWLAACAICLVVARACIQSVTIDEANITLDFVTGPPGVHWFPSSGNHVLFSALDRIVVSIFGISELTLRIPSIIGACIYIVSAIYFSMLVGQRSGASWLLFLCLVYNPMTLDYLVAARGYGLAIGFLFAALTVISDAILSAGDHWTFSRHAQIASFLLALSFAANFSFGYVNAFAILLFFGWALSMRPSSTLEYVRRAAACFIPGIITAVVICGPTVADFPKSQLYFGSGSVSELWQSIVSPLFDVLNPNVVNRWMTKILQDIRPGLPLLTVVCVLALVIGNEYLRWRRSRSDQTTILVRFFVALTFIAFAAHWIAFEVAHIPLPKGRTALFFVLLVYLIVGAGIAASKGSRVTEAVRSLSVLTLFASGVYFIGCLRLGYFNEWQFDKDTKQLYWVLNYAREHCKVSSYGIDWRYSSALDFYRLEYGNTSLPNLPGEESGKLPRDRAAYVLFYPSSEDFIKELHLILLYHNDETGAAVAVRGCEALSRDGHSRAGDTM